MATVNQRSLSKDLAQQVVHVGTKEVLFADIAVPASSGTAAQVILPDTLKQFSVESTVLARAKVGTSDEALAVAITVVSGDAGIFTTADNKIATAITVVTGTNDDIDFDDGAAEVNVVVPAGRYSPTTLAAAMKVAMDAGGAQVYTITFDDAASKFTIASDGGTFNILWNTGVNGAAGLDTSIAVLTGYLDAADDTGATSYLADTALAGEDFAGDGVAVDDQVQFVNGAAAGTPYRGVVTVVAADNITIAADADYAADAFPTVDVDDVDYEVGMAGIPLAPGVEKTIVLSGVRDGLAVGSSLIYSVIAEAAVAGTQKMSGIS